jgi:hypothetical protein
MMKARCGDCRFYQSDGEQCRRRAPSDYHAEKIWIDYHNSELLRDIAWSLRELAKIEEPNPKDTQDDLNREATEANYGDRWPYVDVDEWCGEFEQKEQER